MSYLRGARRADAPGFILSAASETQRQGALSLGMVVALALAILSTALSLYVAPLSAGSAASALRHAERAAAPPARA